MKNKIVVAAIATVSFSATACANETSPAIYAGVEAGFDHVSVQDTGHGNGLAYGGVIGVQQKLGGGFLLGLEGEAMGATTRRSANDLLQVGDSVSIKAGRDLAASLRAGYSVNPSLLLYVKGGYTNARFSASYNDGDGHSGSVGSNFNGYRVGGGFEAGSGKLRFRAEYRYSDYGNLFKTGVNGHRQQILAGVMYGF